MENVDLTELRAHLLRLRVDGWTVVPGVIPARKVPAVRDSVLASTERHNSPEAKPGTGYVPGLINYDQSFAPYLADPRVLGLAGAVLGEHVRISFCYSTVNYPGNKRGGWHADWPFNQLLAGRIPPPFPDAVIHLTTIWMLCPFSPETGATYVVPGTHRAPNNPTAEIGVPRKAPNPSEVQVSGEAGSVLVMDSRIWHASGANRSDAPRPALVVRYAPWWLNLDILMPGSEERRRMVEETGGGDMTVPPVPPAVFEALPEDVRPLFRHWVRA